MSAREKGARGERELAQVLRDRFPELDFQRGLQARGGGAEVPDVEGLPGYHIEVKRVERLNIWVALQQAERDATVRALTPVVCFRRNRGSWHVAMPLDHWVELISRDVMSAHVDDRSNRKPAD